MILNLLKLWTLRGKESHIANTNKCTQVFLKVAKQMTKPYFHVFPLIIDDIMNGDYYYSYNISQHISIYNHHYDYN